ncbi:hypothetical protein MHYP_G00346960 [Metynnis hypsauchen]
MMTTLILLLTTLVFFPQVSHQEVQTPERSSVEPGQSVTFSCVASGGIGYRISWSSTIYNKINPTPHIWILGLPKSNKGQRPSSFFSQLLVGVLGSHVLTVPPELTLIPPGEAPTSHSLILTLPEQRLGDL